jgi:hypothetical protein
MCIYPPSPPNQNAEKNKKRGENFDWGFDEPCLQCIWVASLPNGNNTRSSNIETVTATKTVKKDFFGNQKESAGFKNEYSTVLNTYDEHDWLFFRSLLLRIHSMSRTCTLCPAHALYVPLTRKMREIRKLLFNKSLLHVPVTTYIYTTVFTAVQYGICRLTLVSTISKKEFERINAMVYGGGPKYSKNISAWTIRCGQPQAHYNKLYLLMRVCV